MAPRGLRVCAMAVLADRSVRHRRENRKGQESTRLVAAAVAFATFIVAIAQVSASIAAAAFSAPRPARPRISIVATIDSDEQLEAPPGAAEYRQSPEAHSDAVSLARRQPAFAAVVAGTSWLSAVASEMLLGEPLAARAEESRERVVRPIEGSPVYSFDLPPGRGLTMARFDDEVGQPGLVAKYTSPKGAIVLVGQSPVKDQIERIRRGAPPMRRKVLKYKLGDLYDDLEIKDKIFEEDGSVTILHRWYRFLHPSAANKDGEDMLMLCEVPEDLSREWAPTMEGVLNSFRLGGG